MNYHNGDNGLVHILKKKETCIHFSSNIFHIQTHCYAITHQKLMSKTCLMPKYLGFGIDEP
jgi:hypothetical protein